MSSCTSVAVWMNSTTAAYSTASSPVIAGQPRRHQQHRRTNPLAAAVLDVAADLRDQVDLRLDVAVRTRARPSRGPPGSARTSGRASCSTALRRRRVTRDNLTILARGVSTKPARGSGRPALDISGLGTWERRPMHGTGHGAPGRDALRAKQPHEVAGEARGQHGDRLAPNAGQRLDHARDPGRLVARAAVRHRREIGRVGLDEQPIGGHQRATVSRSASRPGNVTMPENDM